MQTYLLAIFVSLEQEAAIRELFHDRGWHYEKTEFFKNHSTSNPKESPAVEIEQGPGDKTGPLSKTEDDNIECDELSRDNTIDYIDANTIGKLSAGGKSDSKKGGSCLDGEKFVDDDDEEEEDDNDNDDDDDDEENQEKSGPEHDLGHVDNHDTGEIDTDCCEFETDRDTCTNAGNSNDGVATSMKIRNAKSQVIQCDNVLQLEQEQKTLSSFGNNYVLDTSNTAQSKNNKTTQDATIKIQGIEAEPTNTNSKRTIPKTSQNVKQFTKLKKVRKKVKLKTNRKVKENILISTDKCESKVLNRTIKNDHTENVSSSSNAEGVSKRTAPIRSSKDGKNKLSNSIKQLNTSMVECKKVLSAYEIHRHLEPSYTQPMTYKTSIKRPTSTRITSRRLLHKIASRNLEAKRKRRLNRENFVKKRCSIKSEKVKAAAQKVKKKDSKHEISKNTKSSSDSTSLIDRNKLPEKEDGKHYKCSYCKRLFLNELPYLKHVDMHLKSALDCPDCGKKFSSVRNLNSHKYNRSKQRHFVCDICDFEADTACRLRSHKKKTHPPEGTFQCHLCAKIVKTKSYLNVHLKFAHKIDEGKYQCPFCEHKSKRPKLFAKHVKEHLDEKNEYADRTCVICGKVCETKLQFNNHKRVHCEKKYLCDFCGKGFITRSKLQAHNRTHTGVKPYECHLCDYKSTQNGNLRLHMKVHSKETTKDKEIEETPSTVEAQVKNSDNTVTEFTPLEVPTSVSTPVTHKKLPSYSEFLESTNKKSVQIPSVPSTFVQSLQPEREQNITSYVELKPPNTKEHTMINSDIQTTTHQAVEQPSCPLTNQHYNVLENTHSMEVTENNKLTPLPEVNTLSKNIKSKPMQTLYAAEHAEHVPVHMLTDTSELQSSGPGQYDQSNVHSQYDSQFSSLAEAMYASQQTDDYSDNSHLNTVYSQPDIYGISRSELENVAQVYQNTFGFDYVSTVQSIYDSSHSLNENPNVNFSNTANKDGNMSTHQDKTNFEQMNPGHLSLDQTADLGKYTQQKMDYVATATTSVSDLDYCKQDKGQAILSHSIDYGHVSGMNESQTQYMQSSLMGNLQTHPAVNSPQFYPHADHASLTNAGLNTQIPLQGTEDASKMYHYPSYT